MTVEFMCKCIKYNKMRNTIYKTTIKEYYKKGDKNSLNYNYKL